MPLSSLKRVTEFLVAINRHFPPPHGEQHTFFLYDDDSGPKLALQVWTGSSTRMVCFADEDFDRAPEELAAEVIRLIEETP